MASTLKESLMCSCGFCVMYLWLILNALLFFMGKVGQRAFNTGERENTLWNIHSDNRKDFTGQQRSLIKAVLCATILVIHQFSSLLILTGIRIYLANSKEYVLTESSMSLKRWSKARL